jgi:type II secretory pathway pseudopilin PulG
MPKHHYFKAFSLTELVITMGVLGLLSLSMIPIIQNANGGQRKNDAVIKSTLAELEAAVGTAVLRGQQRNAFSLARDALKPVRTCAGDSSAQGCWNSAIQGAGNLSSPLTFEWGVQVERTQGGFVLKSGASLVGVGNVDVPEDGWLLDANGIEGPNRNGADQFWFYICLSATCGAVPGYGNPTAGSIRPYNIGDAPSVALYDRLYGGHSG